MGGGMSCVVGFQAVEVGIGDPHKLGLPSDPTPHIHVTVSSPGPIPVHIQADSRFSFAAGAAAPPRDVEGNRNNGTALEIFYVLANLHDFSDELATEPHAPRNGVASANHALIRTTHID